MSAKHVSEDPNEPVHFTERGKSRSGDSSHIDMTPMVDVVFQLLTFFLLAVKRDSQEPVDVPQVTVSKTVAQDEATFITILAAPPGAAEPTIYVGERKSDPGHSVSLDEIKQEVEAGMRANPPRANVIIKAERLVFWRDVLKVSRIVDSVPNTVLHVGVQVQD